MADDALAGSLNVALVLDALRDAEREQTLVTPEWLADTVYQIAPFADGGSISDSQIRLAVARWRREREGRAERGET